jgi:serine phosphatase RsbU (regulator of sigma subunit)
VIEDDRMPIRDAVTSAVEHLRLDVPLSHLLLVEDDDGDALLVSELLRYSHPDLTVSRARTLAEALIFLATSPLATDVVVLDLGLPDAEGVEIVSRIVTAAPGTAVLVLTGMQDEDRGVAAVSAGAQDYLIKGQVDENLLTRSMRYALGRKRAEESVRRLIESQAQAMENARLERGLLPRPWVHDGSWVIQTGYRPGRHQSLLGGDFFDVVERADGRLHIIIGDVAGHGPDEAALGVLLRVAWRALILSGTPPEAVMPFLSVLLGSERPTEEVFATALYLVVDKGAASATLFNAGHPVPLSVPAAPHVPWALSAGPPLGVVDDYVWAAQAVRVLDRWPVLVYTDGLIEGHCPSGRLGDVGLLGILAEERSHGLGADLIDRLIGRAERANGDALPDDVAVLLINHQTLPG